MDQAPTMKSIWYFVGIILTLMGIVVTLSGVYYYFYPNDHVTVLSHLHPSIWWGGVMIVFGLIFYITNKNSTIE